ncbi:MAG: hypothetical protein C5B60_05390 [Chloroflexi bacterium]|nr:MAG: hypothetical protein C5B60_05390 [Chloroflexota bacterium]
MGWRAAIEVVLIVAGFAANLIVLPRDLTSDSSLRFAELSRLLTEHTLSPQRFSLVGPIFASPLWFLGQVNQSSAWWCLRYNAVLLGLGMLVFYLLLRNRLDRSLLRQFFILLIFASMLTQQLTDFDGEIFSALAVMIGALLVAAWRGKAGWPLIVAGVVNAPASLLGVGIMALERVVQTRRLRYLIPPVVAIALVGLEDWIRRGNPLDSGYHGFLGNVGFRTVMPYSGLPGFSYPLFFGLLSILFSFGKGLVFYMPGLFLPVRKRLLALGAAGGEMLAAYRLWIGFLIGMVLVYSRWWAWYSGWYWGPRFFLLGSMVACFVLAVIVRRPSDLLVANVIYLAVLLLSFWVGIDGALFGQNSLTQVCTANNFALEAFCHYTPEFSALWRPFVVNEPLSLSQVIYLSLSLLACLYISLPLLRRLAGQTTAQLVRLRSWYAELAWHI